MRRITMWGLSTLSVLVLLFSYHTSTSSRATTSIQGPLQAGGGQAAAAQSGVNGSGSSGSSGSSGPSGSSGSSGSSGAAAGTFVGDVVDTRWGVVQVQITVRNGKITKADVLQVPWNNSRDQEINSYVVPIYNQDAVTKQSAQVDVISGATVTWQGYTSSLQSAIDKAHL
jgi:uncharacterized protein with FMN-binding domain